jgi:hypothetical protein
MSDVIKGAAVIQIRMDKRYGVLGSIQQELFESIAHQVKEYFELERDFLELMEEVDNFLEGFPKSNCGCNCDLADWEVEFSKG